MRARLAESRAGLEEATAKSRSEAQTSLQGLASTRRVIARRLREELARGSAALEKAEGERRAAVRAGLEEVASQRRRVAERQRENLAAGRTELASAVRERTAEIHAWLGQVTSGIKAAARRLQETLSREKAGLAQADAQRRSETLTWMGEFTADRLAAGQEWRQMATALRERRAAVIVPEAPAPMPPREEAVVAAAPAPPVEEALEEVDEEEVRAEAGELTPEIAALRDRVFAFLADRPDGVRLVQIERQFGLNRLVSSRVVRSLINEGKSKKQDLLYFAT
ncbi:MAG: hypothetical protein HY680_05805 [Chloroflexi bacterium]|nr:hypothetical protein [Chloroflexota bacterium]